MKRSIAFLYGSCILTYAFVHLLLEIHYTDPLLRVLCSAIMACWTTVIAIMYSSVWRQEVGYEFEGENE